MEVATETINDFEAIVAQTALDAVRAHGGEQPDVEVCGVLVGRVYENESASLVYIDDVIRGNHSSGRSTAVTFTADTWAYIDREMDEKHPGKRIVGWYHTHPGFGIFLSEMDLFIQKHFFNAAWQTALVYDPQTGERGMFAWRKGQTRKVDFVVDDANNLGGPQMERSAGTDASPADGKPGDPVPAAPGSNADIIIKLESLERRQRAMFVGMMAVALLAVTWPLVALMVVPGALRPPPTAPVPPPAVAPAIPDLPDLSNLPGMTGRPASATLPASAPATVPAATPATTPAAVPATTPAANPATTPAAAPATRPATKAAAAGAQRPERTAIGRRAPAKADPTSFR